MNTYTGGTSIDGQGNALVLVTNSSSLGALNGPTLGQVAVQAQAVLAPTGGNVTLGNPFDLISSGGPLTLGRSSDQTDVLTLTGIISGYSQLVIDGPVVLSGNNTYSGGTIINDVNLAIGSQNALGSGSVELTGSSSLTEAYMNPTIDDLSGDPGSTVGLSSGSTLTLYSDYTYPGYPALFYGSIGGDMTNAVVKTGPGAQLIGGDSTYAGGTTVSSGILIAGGNNALGTGPVTVASGAQLQVWSGVTLGNSLNLDPSGGVTLGGNGTFSPGVAVNIASGNTVAPGRNYSYQFNGTLSFGAPVTFGNGGIYDFNVQDGSGAMGVGYTTMDVTGAPLTLSISGSPFQIVVTSIDPSGSGPGFANFNSALSHSWTLVTAPSIAGTFSPTEFSINLSSFQNPLAGGSFSVGESLTTLTLNFTPVPEPSTWLLMAVGLAAVLVQMRRSKRA
jgi:autotransporter-associated beta strand protein